MESKTNYRILIVDDEPPWHSIIRNAFIENYEFEGAVSVEKMWEKLKHNNHFDLLLLDLRLDGTEKKIGLELIPEIKKKYPKIPIIIATNANDAESAVAAMEAGAKTYLFKGGYNKPEWSQKFQEVIQAQKAQEISIENKALKNTVALLTQKEEDEKYKFVGQSKKVLEIKTILENLARESNITVLLTGETGTGKEVAARYMHRMGVRRSKPFVGVNLTAIQPSLLEGSLFGVRKGGYTGATQDIKGYFEQADGGVLLLDEIGDIDANIQIKLLRFLENRHIRAIGSDKDIELDVQVIAATHKNLPQAVAGGTFREDLYHRLKQWVVELPPLRERKDDLMLIVEHYMQLQVPGVAPLEIMEPEALDRLLQYSWPGNVRELRYAVDQMLLRQKMFNKTKIDLDCLPDDVRSGALPLQVQAEIQSFTAHQPQFQSKKEKDAYLDLVKMENALRQAKGNKTAVVAMLGFKGTDHLRARVHTCYKNFPAMFDNFPLVCEHYALDKEK